MAENTAQVEQTLPDGWARTMLGRVQIDKSRSITPKKTPGETFELYSVPSFSEKKPELVRGAEVGSSKRVVEENAVLLCKINPRINRVWIVGDYSPWLKIASTEWIPFFPVEGIDPGYLCYFMQQNTFRDFLALRASGVGGSLMRVKPSTFESYPFLLAPLPEQHRIVAEIETQFTRLDAGVAALERAQANLKRYRASVLKAACEGRLVPTEAELHPGEYEPADQLLTRILAERRARWEAENPGKKYKEPAPPDVENLPELPEGWMWVTLGQVLERIDAGKSLKAQTRPAQNGEFGVLKVSAVSWKVFLPEENKTLFPYDKPKAGSIVKSGDLLISRANTVELVGAVVFVERDYPNLMLSDKTLRLVTASDDVLKRYLLYALRIPIVREYFARKATGTSDSMRNLSQAKFRATPLPLPPLVEQRRIVAEVERRLSVVAVLEAEVEVALARAARLRQSILKRAFEGRLVEQDPNDEPASALLERIKAEREKRTAQQMELVK